MDHLEVSCKQLAHSYIVHATAFRHASTQDFLLFRTHFTVLSGLKHHIMVAPRSLAAEGLAHSVLAAVSLHTVAPYPKARVVTGTEIVHDHQPSRNFKCRRSMLPNRLK